VRLAVIGRLGWIKRQQARFQAQPRISPREFVSGESHYVFGRRHRLRVVPNKGRSKIILRPQTRLELHIRRDARVAQKNRILQAWYRDQLKVRIPGLLAKWQPILGVKAAGWGIRKMKTCHVETQRIWLNVELATKPVQCLEYILVHELAHLIERTHNDRFVAVMNRVLPQWRLCRQKLNSAP
jgi:predicted metal-dependent hydrolase